MGFFSKPESDTYYIKQYDWRRSPDVWKAQGKLAFCCVIIGFVAAVIMGASVDVDKVVQQQKKSVQLCPAQPGEKAKRDSGPIKGEDRKPDDPRGKWGGQ
jgi:hypothetical protein